MKFNISQAAFAASSFSSWLILYRKEGWYMNVKGWTVGYHNDGDGSAVKSSLNTRDGAARVAINNESCSAAAALLQSIDNTDTIDTILQSIV